MKTEDVDEEKAQSWYSDSYPRPSVSSVVFLSAKMALSIRDYLIDHAETDWSKVLRPWSWLLPAEFTIWLVNRFCDVFLIMDDGTVHMLDVGSGALTRLADGREDFCRQIDENRNADDWLMIPLVDELVANGMKLQAGQCYGFKISPVIGGEYSMSNCAVFPIWDYLGATGSIHEQLLNVPDGTQVTLEVINPPPRPDSDGRSE